MNKYVPSQIGKTESLISIEIIDDYCGDIDLNTFIKNYKISKFFKGKFFFIRLIKKIFKYKLNEPLCWNSDFWEKISIIKVNASISIYKNNYTNFELSLKKTVSNKRLKNIYEYKKLIENGTDLGIPLYITGDTLNFLGARTKIDELFMLDGSRRLLSLLLAKKKTTNLLLIKLKNN